MTLSQNFSYAKYLVEGSQHTIGRNRIYEAMRQAAAEADVQRIAVAQEAMFLRVQKYVAQRMNGGGKRVDQKMFQGLLSITKDRLLNQEYAELVNVKNVFRASLPQKISKELLTAIALTNSRGVTGTGVIPGKRNQVLLLLTDSSLIYSEQFKFRIFYWESVRQVEICYLHGTPHHFNVTLHDASTETLAQLTIPANTSFGNTFYYSCKQLPHINFSTYPSISFPSQLTNSIPKF